MQLFTVGTVQLNPDGSEVLVGGNPVPTYDNEDSGDRLAVQVGLPELSRTS